MKKLNSKGFTVVEAIIVLVVLGIVGGGSWYVWSKQNKTQAPSDNTNTSQTNQVTSDATPQTKTEPTVHWLLSFTSQNNKFSVSIPDGWKLTQTEGYDMIYAWNASEIVYKDGTTGEVATTSGGRDGSSIAFSMYLDPKSGESVMPPESRKISTYMTESGITVDKYTRTQTKVPEDMDIPKGTTEYQYILRLNDKQIRIVHDVLVGETEQTKIIEQMIATVKFL